MTAAVPYGAPTKFERKASFGATGPVPQVDIKRIDGTFAVLRDSSFRPQGPS